MKEYTIHIGQTEEDALFIQHGFTFVYNDQRFPYRQCHQTFAFDSLVPESGSLILEMDIQFDDPQQTLDVYIADDKAGTLQPLSDQWHTYTIPWTVPDDLDKTIDRIPVVCLLHKDPYYPPKRPVRLRRVTMKACSALRPSADLMLDKIRQYPIKVTNCYRTYHEIRKLAPTYHCRADEHPYSDEQTIYFGDMHVHTEYSQCGAPYNGTMEQNVIWAKERGHDFICFADHAETMDVETFRQYFNQCKRLGDQYDILVIPCIEWTSFEYGHRNVYLDTFDLPYFSSHMYQTNTPARMKQFFEEQHVNAFAITHHPAYVSHPANLHSIDDTFEPLIEIYSTWGSSESYQAPLQESQQTLPGFFAFDALKMGKKLGFVGGGDVHNTKPGDGGITGIIAKELSLPALYQSLKQRRCYAIANDPIKLDFHLNGYPMGSILTVNQYSMDKLFPIQIAASTICEHPILKMELLQNGEVIYEKTHREAKNEMDLFVEYDKLMTPARITNPWNSHLSNTSRYYAIRVTQMDGSTAWSSPIWIDIIPNG